MKRPVDEVGRVVIPIEWRRTMGIDVFNKDIVMLDFDGDKVTISKPFKTKEDISKEIARLEKLLQNMEDEDE